MTDGKIQVTIPERRGPYQEVVDLQEHTVHGRAVELGDVIVLCAAGRM
jgi:hypothetical protein